jgi:hypothetical protein
MNARDHNQWIEANQTALGDELSWLRALLENADGESTDPPDIEAPDSTAFTLDYLTERFGLSHFERTLVLLCAGMELDSGLANSYGNASPGAVKEGPTFGMALALLPEAHWSALSPDSPLRYWQLIQVDSHRSITTARLSLDERILHFLLGAASLDERLSGLVRPLGQGSELPESQQLQVGRLTSLWRDRENPPVILLQGNDPDAGREVAVQACASLGMQALLMRAQDVDQASGERSHLARLLTREHLLSNAALLIDGGNQAPRRLAAFMEQLECPLMLLGERPGALRRNSSVIQVDKPTTAEQRGIWKGALGGLAAFEESWLLPLAVQFDFSSLDIRTTVESVDAEQQLGTPLKQALWQHCRQHSRGSLGRLAQRIKPCAGWDDLVLPRGQKAVLRDVSRQVHHRATVYEAWGFAAKSERGLGISALFSGESGTGKTMAAEVLAADLDLDLYRIDLSSVVSKYIGETEKNLERLFRAAETSGAILLFDEADALFGKRSEVKDSHDRYANIELAYLLQRMEAYRGLSILTSNIKSSLDTAFLRRIRFVVQFPFPDVAQRNAIWQRVLPDSLPRTGLRSEQLARLHVAGGNIRNIAMNAAFLAAEKGDPMCMEDLAHATRMEFAKLEKPLNEAELRSWT